MDPVSKSSDVAAKRTLASYAGYYIGSWSSTLADDEKGSTLIVILDPHGIGSVDIVGHSRGTVSASLNDRVLTLDFHR